MLGLLNLEDDMDEALDLKDLGPENAEEPLNVVGGRDELKWLEFDWPDKNLCNNGERFSI